MTQDKAGQTTAVQARSVQLLPNLHMRGLVASSRKWQPDSERQVRQSLPIPSPSSPVISVPHPLPPQPCHLSSLYPPTPAHGSPHPPTPALMRRLAKALQREPHQEPPRQGRQLLLPLSGRPADDLAVAPRGVELRVRVTGLHYGRLTAGTWLPVNQHRRREKHSQG